MGTDYCISADVVPALTAASGKRPCAELGPAASDTPAPLTPPTAAFLNQWERALFESGVPASHITRFVRDDQHKLCEDECFILLSRHSLMAETRHVLKGHRSNLFPFLPIDLLELLQTARIRGGSVENMTRAIGTYSKSITRKRFRTLIIDECHTMRNLLTFGK